jgi:Fic family protein
MDADDVSLMLFPVTRPPIYELPMLRSEELEALEKIERLRRELRIYVAEPRRWVGSVARVLRARAIQGSNSIEGYNVSVEDAVAAIEGDEPTDALLRDWQAVESYRRAMTYVLQLARDEHFAYSPGLLRSLHFMMTEYSLEASPGLWRGGPIWIRNDVTGAVVYEAPEADEVPGLIDHLVRSLSDAGDAPSMVRAAMAHLNLAMIHPFRDGNGRMSRCLQTLILARDQILAPEWCSIEEYLGRNTDAYYRVLADVGRDAWHPEHDARPWVRFCLEAHYIQAGSVLRRIRESERMWHELETLVDAHHLPSRTILGLFDLALGLKIRNSSYRKMLAQAHDAVSNQTATSDLRMMVQAGLAGQRGRKRGTFYVPEQPLLDIRERARAGRARLSAESLFPVVA